MANEDRLYLRWLAWQPCIVCGRRTGAPPHHPRHDVAMGKRAHDHRAVPLCSVHHEDAQGYRGAFEVFGRDGMRAFFDEAAVMLRDAWEKLEQTP